MPTPLDLHRTLAVDLPPADLAILSRDVRAHFEHLAALSAKHELLAIDLAEHLCERLEVLIDLCPSLDAEARAAIVGAARYFVSAHDAVPDAQDCIGLDDDVAVFNHVVRAIGRADLEIKE
jgi:adenylate cyclase